MKRIPFVLLAILVLTVLAVPVMAQMGGYMHESGEETEEGVPPYGYGMGPGMMGPGMMGPGYGGCGMMGPGYGGGYGYGMGPGYGCGMGPGMMGPGYGGCGMMGPSMMGPGYGGYGMGPGWGRHRGYGWQDSKEFQKFLDATHDLRKKIHDKMFEYMEMVWSGADREKLEAAWKEIEKLRKELHKKAQEMMK